MSRRHCPSGEIVRRAGFLRQRFKNVTQSDESFGFLLSRIDFVDDDDDDEEEEEDKPSSSESSDAKKNEKQQQTKRTRRRESKRSRENNTLFQSFRCDSSACNLYVLFEFFSLQRAPFR